MVGEPSHLKQLSLNHVCKIGLRRADGQQSRGNVLGEALAFLLKIQLDPSPSPPPSYPLG